MSFHLLDKTISVTCQSRIIGEMFPSQKLLVPGFSPDSSFSSLDDSIQQPFAFPSIPGNSTNLQHQEIPDMFA